MKFNFDVSSIKSINAHEYYQLKDQNASFQLIDVRSFEERQVKSLGGTHIPLDQIASTDLIEKEGKVIFYCEGGVRSLMAIHELCDHPNAKNFYNLEGGIQACLMIRST